jgi:DNA-binding response OmpR family regulator/predicted  nucleic acid-binding Zn-ribbon protein
MSGVLIFESDMEFAHGLRGELVKHGCNVDIVSDANQGLEQATAKPPDLILLCTELPKMNGFSVCNRLKRDPVLENVPVIIMSANASEETFQQHRNLTKKRAQDYVHKPISFEEMIGRVGKFINLNGNAAPVHAVAAGDELEVEDMDELDEVGSEVAPDLSPSEFDNPIPAEATSAARPSERVMNELTEEVFGALMQQAPASAPRSAPPAVPPGSGLRSSLPPGSVAPGLGPQSSPGSRPPAEASAPASARPNPTARPALSAPPPPNHLPMEVNGELLLNGDARRSSRSTRRRSGFPNVEAIPGAARVPMISEPSAPDHAPERMSELEQTLAETRAKLEAVYQELDAARTKEASGSARAREILDLREALNKKDKEIIDLKDQLTRRDKELLAANDSLLELERRNTEAREQIVETEKRANAADRAVQAMSQDREQATKRADSYKRKLEKALEDLEQLNLEHEELGTEHKNLRAKLEQTEAQGTELTGKLADATRRGDDLQADLNDAEKELASLEEQNERLQRGKQAGDQQLQQLTAAFNELTQRHEQHRNAEATVRELLGQAARRLGELG